MITMDSLRTRLVKTIEQLDKNAKILMVSMFGVTITTGVLGAVFFRIDLLLISAMFAGVSCSVCRQYRGRFGIF